MAPCQALVEEAASVELMGRAAKHAVPSSAQQKLPGGIPSGKLLVGGLEHFLCSHILGI